MNNDQKSTAIIVAITLGLMLLFPPVEFLRGGTCGYRFILSTGGCDVNIPRLLIQWLGVIIIGGIMYCVLKDSESE